MRYVIALAAAALISGCASLGNSEPSSTSNVDYGKIARIEAAARSVGVNVYWVNLPTKSGANALN